MPLLNIKTVLENPCPQKATYQVQGLLVNEKGAIIPVADITTFTLTLYRQNATLDVINGRSAQNILNTNGGTMDAQGNVVVKLSPADNVLAAETVVEEVHIILLAWTYNGGLDAGYHECQQRVLNLAKVS